MAATQWTLAVPWAVPKFTPTVPEKPVTRLQPATRQKGFLEGRDCSQRVAFQRPVPSSFLLCWQQPRDPALSCPGSLTREPPVGRGHVQSPLSTQGLGRLRVLVGPDCPRGVAKTSGAWGASVTHVHGSWVPPPPGPASTPPTPKGLSRILSDVQGPAGTSPE